MAETATDHFWLDNTEGALSRAVGKDTYYISRLEKTDPRTIEKIMQLGRGQFIIGHIRYIEEINKLFFYFGELYNILGDKKYGLYEKWRNRPDFRFIKRHSFSSKEQSLSFERYIHMKQYISEMIDIAIEIKALEEYDLTDEYQNLQKKLRSEIENF